jgi:hypothetical protein
MAAGFLPPWPGLVKRFCHVLFPESLIDGTEKSLTLDGAEKSSRSRLAQFRRMQRTYLYVNF